MPRTGKGSEANGALRWIETQLGERPNDAGLWYGKGVLLAKAGDLEKALEALDKALKLDPDHVKALEAKGKALFKMERYLEAYDVFRKLTKKVRKDEEYWYLCGESLVKLGRREKAISYYDEALEINPIHTDSVYGRANALRGMLEEPPTLDSATTKKVDTSMISEPGDMESADRPDDFDETVSRAKTAFYNDDCEEALRLFEKALEIDDTHSAVWEAKGRVLSRLSRFTEAVECYEKATRGTPDDSSARFRQGKTPNGNGWLAEARESYDEVVRLDPDNLETRVQSRGTSAGMEDLPEEKPRPAADGTHQRIAQLPPIPTNIDLLDTTLEGGVSPGSVVLITGMPGTFKTSLCFWILFQHCVREGTKGLFITVEQSKESLLKHVASMGLDPAAAAGNLQILDLARFRRQLGSEGLQRDWLDVLKERVLEVRRSGVQVLALDSLEALESMVNFEDRRGELHRLFEFLRSLYVTSFLTAERYELDYEGQLIKVYDVPEYLSDGVLELTWRRREGGDLQRALRVVKMRDRKHSTSLYFLYWDDGFKLAQALTAPPP